MYICIGVVIEVNVCVHTHSAGRGGGRWYNEECRERMAAQEAQCKYTHTHTHSKTVQTKRASRGATTTTTTGGKEITSNERSKHKHTPYTTKFTRKVKV